MSHLETTRLSLHAVAELVLAGPQFAECGTIKLRVTPGGFGTVATPDARVDETSLVVAGHPVPLDGRTVSDLAAAAGLSPRTLDDVYSDGCGLSPSHPLSVDEACAAQIAEAFRRGDEALAALDPDEARVLWPEHFDVGISLDEVNYGVSPGDAGIPEPYAYVGPWSPADFTGPFWNTSFGAARPMAELDDVRGFFEEGRSLTART